MKVFLSGSIRGGRQNLPVYQQMVQIVENQGHDVASLHVADPHVEENEAGMSESEIFERDMHLLDGCDCMIAEVSIASTGVGYEVCSALNLGIPVQCVYREGSTVSAMLLGNTNHLILLDAYREAKDLEALIPSFLDFVSGEDQVE
jgi:nucleoside 2-deoxyribosyltransferase